MNPKKNRERMVEMLFEKWRPEKLQRHIQSCGRVTGDDDLDAGLVVQQRTSLSRTAVPR